MLITSNPGHIPRKQRALRSNGTKAPQIRLRRNLSQHLRDRYLFHLLWLER